jgi:ABC-type Fe3+ transport system substrate-binding protein
MDDQARRALEYVVKGGQPDMKRRKLTRLTRALLLGFLAFGQVPAAESQSEWESALKSAKKEGKIVIAIPPSAELRKELEPLFKEKFGIEAELVVSRGADSANRIASEFKAGVRYFDLIIQGTTTAMSLQDGGMLDPVSSYMILPEVKDPKYWWGGHIWNDNLKTNRFLYSFIANAGTEGLFYNAELAKPEEFRSFDDLLNPKWKGKIGLNDPRIGGSGISLWSFMWETKGEEYLQKLVRQDLLLGRNLRQIAEALAKGKLAITIGLGRAEYEPFIKAGLPVKELPRPKEGLPSSSGYGVLGIVKDPPHPNATKVFVNWFLGKEGQEFYAKVMKQGTRRLDVDTKWMSQVGVDAAKDVMTLEEYHRVRNHLEDKVINVRRPAAKFAEKILQ